MNTKNNKTLLASIVFGVLALVAATKVAAIYVPATAIVVSYTAVALLVVIAATDYRIVKNYSAR